MTRRYLSREHFLLPSPLLKLFLRLGDDLPAVLRAEAGAERLNDPEVAFRMETALRMAGVGSPEPEK